MSNDYAERMERATALLRSIFSTSLGSDCLEVIEDELGINPIKRSDPLETYYRLGQASVIAKIVEIVEGEG